MIGRRCNDDCGRRGAATMALSAGMKSFDMFDENSSCRVSRRAVLGLVEECRT
jgi:hypothetical protein